jgi:hypothetical protein
MSLISWLQDNVSDLVAAQQKYANAPIS